MDLRHRLLRRTDQALAALLATAVCGTALAFGGAVWWARPALAALLVAIVAAWLLRSALMGSWRLMRSPLGLIGAMALVLAVFQLAPLPGRWAAKVSPLARAAHTQGLTPEQARQGSATPDAAGSRTPATLDRSATLRWLAGAAGLLALFVVAAHFADRLGHALVIWGSVVAAFAVNTVLALVQLVSGADGLYGAIQPGQGAPAAPGLADALAAPGASALRLLADPAHPGSAWAVARPEPPFLIGTLMGGPGAYLALASLALPLGLGLALQAMAPRGSRQGLLGRLNESNLLSLVAFLVAVTLAGSVVAGVLAGRLLALPLAAGLVLAGVLPARATGLRWAAVALAGSALLALAAGVVVGEAVGRPAGVAPLAERPTLGELRRSWAESARIARDFPLVGSGLGSFATIVPYYKSQDETRTVAGSSLLQWGVESGLAGLGLLGLAALWCLARLPFVLRRVGTADRALAWGLIGALASFAAFSALHWTVELAAVAVAACAVGGTAHRWLAGGTDLFVEPA